MAKIKVTNTDINNFLDTTWVIGLTCERLELEFNLEGKCRVRRDKTIHGVFDRNDLQEAKKLYIDILKQICPEKDIRYEFVNE